MKKIALRGFVTGAALLTANALQAADLKTAASYASAQPAIASSWTGFYAGLNVGVGASQTNAFANPVVFFPGSVDRGGRGITAGVQGGFNWQFAPNWVAGAEGDFSVLPTDRSFTVFDSNVAIGVKTNRFGSLRGRLGYTNGPSLFYATGGMAFVNLANNLDVVPPSQPNFVSRSENATGWIVGGGIETMLGGNWSAKAEYLYSDVGGQDISNSNISDKFRFENRFHVYRYGLNYRFGVPGPSADMVVPHSWNGFYAGVNGGVGLSQDAVNVTAIIRPGNSADIVGAGFTGGIQAGYNWQPGANWVIGLEGDFGYLAINRKFLNVSVSLASFGVKTDWYGTFRGRIGYSTGQTLIYITGGAAIVNLTNSFDDSTAKFASSETATGWTLGGGIETALTQEWSAKTEYIFIDAGSQDVADAGFTPSRIGHFDNRFHVFRYGLNFKFGG